MDSGVGTISTAFVTSTVRKAPIQEMLWLYSKLQMQVPLGMALDDQLLVPLWFPVVSRVVAASRVGMLTNA